MNTNAPPSSDSGPGPASRPRRRWLALAGAAVVTLLVLAVTYTTLTQPTPAPAAASLNAGPSTAATAFIATTTDGEEVPVPGGKASVVFFFSSSCGSCGPGAHALPDAQTSTPDANYIAVDIDPSESVAVVRDFLNTNNASTLSYARDTDGGLTRAYQLSQLSTAVVLDASGTEVYRGVDPTPTQIRSALTKAGAQ